MSSELKTVIYDIETFKNFFSYTEIDLEGNKKVFIIHETNNQYEELMQYLLTPTLQVGYNNQRFDSVVLAWMYEARKRLKDKSPNYITESVYNFVQRIINSDEPINIRPLTKQIDLYLINHFNNKARSTSLKALQCNMYWSNVMDMPFSHDHIVKDSEIDEILEYNLNDVLSTKQFYDLNKDNIEIRKTFSELYGKDFTNKSNVAIGEEIFLHYIKQASGLTKKELQEKVIHHKKILLKNCILPYIKFNSRPMQRLLSDIKNSTVDAENKFKKSINYKGFNFDFGVGGIHGCVPAGIYKAKEDELIIDYDVKSYYPNLAIQNGFHPLHIDKDVFCNTYKQIFEERVQKQKEGKDLEQAGLKLSLNGIFGKSGEETSAFHDRYFFYRITLNGQLSLAMLAEAFLDFIPGLEILQINTDGLTVKIKKEQEEKCERIIDRFMERTKLIMEKEYYKQMLIRDVNNYIGEYANPLKKPKLKGIFATSVDWHQNNSFLAIPKAILEYFLRQTPVEETLRKNDNIYDFCGRYKATKGWEAQYKTSNREEDRVVVQTHHFGKILRFYPTTEKKGSAVKVHKDGREISLLSGWSVEPFNTYVKKEMTEYNIDYTYFIVECQKVIDQIEKKQLTLF